MMEKKIVSVFLQNSYRNKVNEVKYQNVKDILYAVFTDEEIKIAGLNGFCDATDRIHDDRQYPKGMSKSDYNRIIKDDDVPYPSKEKEQKFKQLVKDFLRKNPKCSIYQNVNELEHCAIRYLY